MPRTNANVKALLEDNKELTARNEELLAALEEAKKAINEQKSFIDSSIQNITISNQNPVMVPVKNYSGSEVFHTYEFRGQKRTLHLTNTGSTQTGSLPFEVWEQLERDGKMVESGAIVRTDLPIDNPNCFDDIEGFITDSAESEIRDRLDRVTNRHVLTFIMQHIEQTPENERTQNQLTAYASIKKNMFEKFNIQLIEYEE